MIKKIQDKEVTKSCAQNMITNKCHQKISFDFKEKSKCAECLTKRTFIHEIKKTTYDLESELEVCLQFYIGWCYKIAWGLIEWSAKKILKT